MPGKWSVKNPLTLIERKMIQEALEMHASFSYNDIAKYVQRSKKTIIRECKRLGNEKYDAEKAQKHFENLQLETRNNAKKINRTRNK